ncbi:MAG: hypothetical protein OFPI_42140 [Osedax symbiont Rs2]|nr:MAG: hypothetical protein OFPI_42140 [Osedax symbiont Rs2]
MRNFDAEPIFRSSSRDFWPNSPITPCPTQRLLFFNSYPLQKQTPEYNYITKQLINKLLLRLE